MYYFSSLELTDAGENAGLVKNSTAFWLITLIGDHFFVMGLYAWMANSCQIIMDKIASTACLPLCLQASGHVQMRCGSWND